MKAVKTFKIEFYLDDNGIAPAIVWIESLKNVKTQARIFKEMDKLESGNLGGLKSLGSGLHEVRMFFGAGYRMYVIFDEGKIIVVLCGGDKSTQSKDIERARDYAKRYKEK